MELLNELSKIHWQRTVPGAVLMAIRSRIEFKRGISERLGKAFPDGNKGTLLVGKGGTGKTRLLKNIFDGLGLDSVNKEGRQIGKWVSSAGVSTGVGIAETLELYNDSIIFIDEFCLDTPAHLHIAKQVASSCIQRPKHDHIEAVPFTGMLVCATNSIKVPRNNALEHLLATLDRFTIVKTKAPNLAPKDYLQMAMSTPVEEKIDWNIIKQAIVSNNNDTLNNNEQLLLEKLWDRKCREILDTTRAQWRNAHAARDICLFVKRFLGLPDISKNKEAIKFVSDMMNDSILFNPISILWLTPLEEVIYNTIESKNEVALQEVVRACDNSGISVSVKHVHHIINTLIENMIIYRTRHGMYSTKKLSTSVVQKSNNTGDVMSEVL